MLEKGKARHLLCFCMIDDDDDDDGDDGCKRNCKAFLFAT